MGIPGLPGASRRAREGGGPPRPQACPHGLALPPAVPPPPTDRRRPLSLSHLLIHSHRYFPSGRNPQGPERKPRPREAQRGMQVRPRLVPKPGFPGKPWSGVPLMPPGPSCPSSRLLPWQTHMESDGPEFYRCSSRAPGMSSSSCFLPEKQGLDKNQSPHRGHSLYPPFGFQCFPGPGPAQLSAESLPGSPGQRCVRASGCAGAWGESACGE